ncbi:ribosome small subunit-dependent GTPase A [Aquihabitans sp. McL0605]|uniref:ribosome small subunit-dependent GTPase A n=1 Tax=Aquihabitans sp. McL0605 TaxID=3415671 RepID=UPI003CF8BA65
MTELLARYGWDDRWSSRFDEYLTTSAAAEVDGPVPGRVIRHDGAGLMVALESGPVRAMFGPPITPRPVVGDWVVLDRTSTPVATLPRDSLLRRRAAGTSEKEQAMAANVDLVLVVCGLDRPVRGGRIQRTITIALDAGAESLVVLTKADKVGPEVAAEAEMIAHEVDAALEVVTLSAKGGWGIDDLLDRVGQRTVALIGESGAGKSTLVNALMEGEVAAEGDVREGDSKGRHTTTHRELHLLDGGGVLVDTPGIREVGIWTDTDAVAESFPDIEELAERCRFRDCAHQKEPGCAVRAAVAAGTLAPERLEAWRALDAEAASAELRADVVEHRRRNRQFGRIAREAQQLKDDRRNR